MRRGLVLLLALVLLLVLLSACGDPVRGPTKEKHYVEVGLNTSDNLTLAASYYDSPSDKGLVLLHMMGKSKSSWGDIPDDLVDNYKIIAFDFRGHGRSDGDFTQMTDRDFKNLTYDLEAAIEYLRWRGVNTSSDLSLVGASIGANVAYLYALDHRVDKLVLVAPGSILRGLDISRFSYRRPMLVQVGYYDAYSSISVDNLQTNWDKAHVEFYESSAHGTDLYDSDVSAREDLIFYLT